MSAWEALSLYINWPCYISLASTDVTERTRAPSKARTRAGEWSLIDHVGLWLANVCAGREGDGASQVK
jgi:hypothetical protein